MLTINTLNIGKKKEISLKKESTEKLKSINIYNKHYEFTENCYSKWLKGFLKIDKDKNSDYELDFKSDNIESCLLGQGGSGFVFKYKCNSDKYAIKFFVDKSNRDKEVKKMKRVNTLFEDQGESANFRVTIFIEEKDIKIKIEEQDIKFYCIVMDLADGTIKDIMCDHHKKFDGKLEESLLLQQIIHLSETIQTIHNSKIAHRDIKPENILLKGELPVLADFGLSGDISDTIRRKGPKYWPNPEFIQTCEEELQKIDHKSDIFNLGCVFFYFFTGKYPIGEINFDTELKKVHHKIKSKILQMIDYNKETRLDDISELISILENQKKVVKYKVKNKLDIAQVNNRMSKVKK